MKMCKNLNSSSLIQVYMHINVFSLKLANRVFSFYKKIWYEITIYIWNSFANRNYQNKNQYNRYIYLRLYIEIREGKGEVSAFVLFYSLLCNWIYSNILDNSLQLNCENPLIVHFYFIFWWYIILNNIIPKLNLVVYFKLIFGLFIRISKF